MSVKQTPSATKLAKYFSYDKSIGVLLCRRSGKAITSKTNFGYIRVVFEGQYYQAHRLIWKLVTGKEPKVIDHINGIKDDNRWENLRSVSIPENQRNKGLYTNNTSGVSGVSINDSGSWSSSITVDRKKIKLGTFKTFSQAVVARRRAEAKYGFHSNSRYSNGAGESQLRTDYVPNFVIQ